MRTLIARVEQPARRTRRERRAERVRLKRLDALSARLAELRDIRVLLEEAAAVVSAGWVQGAWFSVTTDGGTRTVAAYDLRLAVDNPVTGACLVGAVVQAAGGPATVRSQPVQRALDLLWHALREDADRPVRWCPGPDVRLMHLLGLTQWNDAPARTQREVVDLLLGARATVDAQREMCRVEHAGLAAIGEPSRT